MVHPPARAGCGPEVLDHDLDIASIFGEDGNGNPGWYREAGNADQRLKADRISLGDATLDLSEVAAREARELATHRHLMNP
jgi:hypothetical protein